ncbi:hypothetical protein ACJX0J_039919 [Zea mays]
MTYIGVCLYSVKNISFSLLPSQSMYIGATCSRIQKNNKHTTLILQHNKSFLFHYLRKKSLMMIICCTIRIVNPMTGEKDMGKNSEQIPVTESVNHVQELGVDGHYADDWMEIFEVADTGISMFHMIGHAQNIFGVNHCANETTQEGKKVSLNFYNNAKRETILTIFLQLNKTVLLPVFTYAALYIPYAGLSFK